MSKTIPFSRANRRQICTADLIAGLIGNIHPDVLTELKKPQHIQEIISNLTNVYKQISPDYPKFPFDQKNYPRFNKIILKLRSFIKESFTDGITLDMLNAVVLLAEKAYQGSLKTDNTELQETWSDITASLFHLYGEIDPEFEEDQWMRLGAAMSRNIEVIIQI